MLKAVAAIVVIAATPALVAGDGYNVPEAERTSDRGLRPLNDADRRFDVTRFPRLRWLDSHLGESEEPTVPFCPIEVDEPSRTLRILGRELVLGDCGLPQRYVTHFNGSNTRILETGCDVLASPFAFGIPGAGAVRPKAFRFTERNRGRVRWQAEYGQGDAAFSVDGELGFDGFASFRISVRRSGPARGVRLGFGLRRGFSIYQMGLGREGGFCPDECDWRFSPTNHQDATWIGGVNGGMMIRFKGSNYAQPLINAYYRWKPLRIPDSWGEFSVALRRDSDGATVTAESDPTTGTGSAVYAFDLYLTPFKPIDVRKQVSDRYAHIPQHAGRMDFSRLARDGATVVNLHHNTIWNPYINYPYGADGGPYLKKAVREAHAAGLRLKVYYTTREITQNMPEMAALAGLGGEIVFRRPKDVGGWPVTNPAGPHPWLVANLGDDVLPAWRETISFPQAYPPRADLAVITNPESVRWNNFYLAGLGHLVKEYGIDGIYIDDTALNRAALMRARRILDADGDRGRRIDMHSWNHRSPLAGRANSAIVFLDLYPYADRIWYGEGFDPDKPAEYWLVERSGIPFGLMGEQLSRISPFRGMVYLMTARYIWCDGDPRGFWSFFGEADFGAADLTGWWDGDCPVAFSCPQVKVSAYRTPKGIYVAVANFSGSRARGRLVIDWRKLGFAAEDARLSQPAIRGIQPGRPVVGLADEFEFCAGDGAIFRLERKR